jgi:hypothetical protein
MITVKVVNKGRRIRDRLGSRFLPNEEQILEVNPNQYIALKAVRDFEVEILDNNSDIDSNNANDIDIAVENNLGDSEINNDHNSNDDLDYYDLTVDEVLKAVEEGKFSVEEVIGLEVAGKNRRTLLDKLEDMK